MTYGTSHPMNRPSAPSKNRHQRRKEDSLSRRKRNDGPYVRYRSWVDNDKGESVPCEVMSDGTIRFAQKDIPSDGTFTFSYTTR